MKTCRSRLAGDGALTDAIAGKPGSHKSNTPNTFEIKKNSMRTLQIEPLTKEAFAPFGDVIETDGSDHFMINNGSTMRFHKLATVEPPSQKTTRSSAFSAPTRRTCR